MQKPTHLEYQTPKTSIYVKDNTAYVEFEVPGVPVENISIHVKGDVLSLSTISRPATRFQEETKHPNYYKTMLLPFHVDVSRMKAWKEEDNALKLVLPRSTEERPIVSPEHPVEVHRVTFQREGPVHPVWGRQHYMHHFQDDKSALLEPPLSQYHP